MIENENGTENNGTENPATEGTNPPAENTANTTAETSVPKVPLTETSADSIKQDDVTITVTGEITETVTVAKGTKLSAALKSDKKHSVQFRDSSNRAVSLDRAINDNMTITAIRKAAGG